MPTTYKQGLDGKAYYAANLHEALPTPVSYVELAHVESVEHEMSATEGTVDNRQSRFTRYGVGQIAKSYSIPMTYASDDASQIALFAAAQAGTVVGLAVMDGNIATSGTKGWLMDAVVTASAKPEELSEFDTVTFTFKPAAKSTYFPTRTTIA